MLMVVTNGEMVVTVMISGDGGVGQLMLVMVTHGEMVV